MVERLVLLIAVVALVAVALLVARRWVARRAASRLGLAAPAELSIATPGVPTVIYFYGPACAACDSQKQALGSLGSDVNVVPVDAARQHELASWAGVLTIPSTAILDRGRRLRVVNHGYRTASDLSAQLAEIA